MWGSVKAILRIRLLTLFGRAGYHPVALGEWLSVRCPMSGGALG